MRIDYWLIMWDEERVGEQELALDKKRVVKFKVWRNKSYTNSSNMVKTNN
jgi:hypothetical protein